MFTGIVRDLGRIAQRSDTPRGARLRIATTELAPDTWQVGDSVAVNGVCLTAVALSGRAFEVDISAETLARSTLGALGVDAVVNLEPALRLGDALGGHLVSGHVDGIGRVRRIEPEGSSQRWFFDAPAALARYLAEKGSITVDGVSLTVASVDADGFAVALIPHTLSVTTLGALGAGAVVNLEIDLIARYLARLVEQRGAFADGEAAHGL